MALEEKVGSLLVDKGLVLVTAESCTGGLLAHRITNVPGSSAYYLGGFVAYAYEAKEVLLGVRHETLLAHGAVSEETAMEMARGVRQRLDADLGIAITGVAGPAGGTPEKPVGLVFLALSAPGVDRCQRHVWKGDRVANKEQSVEAALQLVLNYLREQKMSMEFVNELVGVEVRQRKDGTALPLAFVWQGRRYGIESWGRESEKMEEDRTLRCYLVQTAGAETWELGQDMETAQWTIVRRWAGRFRIV